MVYKSRRGSCYAIPRMVQIAHLYFTYISCISNGITNKIDCERFPFAFALEFRFHGMQCPVIVLNNPPIHILYMCIPYVDTILCNVFIQNFAKIHTEMCKCFCFLVFLFLIHSTLSIVRDCTIVIRASSWLIVA